MCRVAFQNVAKTYPNGVEAVRQLNLEVVAGELFVLVGPSGCGKTTTLRLVAGLESVSQGEIFIGDRAVNAVATADRDVAMVLQNAALYPHMSVFENMAFGLKMRRTARADVEMRVKEAAEALEIGPLLARRPAELSGGERRRVAIGRAIVRAPQVFLFDEPLTDLDPPLRSQLRSELKRLHAKLRTTTVYVTHDQAEAMTLGDRIGVMENGEVRQVGPPIDVYERPASAFVASFLGSPAMNLIPGEMHNGVFRWQNAAENGKAAGGEINVGESIPNGRVTLGVRPSDSLLDGNGSPVARVPIELVERLGHETLVHFPLASGSHVARLTGDATVRVGDVLQLSVRPEAMHLFSADDGRRLN